MPLLKLKSMCNDIWPRTVWVPPPPSQYSPELAPSNFLVPTTKLKFKGEIQLHFENSTKIKGHKIMKQGFQKHF